MIIEINSERVYSLQSSKNLMLYIMNRLKTVIARQNFVAFAFSTNKVVKYLYKY